MAMSDIEIKKFIEDVVKPFFDNDVPLLAPRLQRLRHEANKKAKEQQELVDREAELKQQKVLEQKAEDTRLAEVRAAVRRLDQKKKDGQKGSE